MISENNWEDASTINLFSEDNSTVERWVLEIPVLGTLRIQRGTSSGAANRWEWHWIRHFHVVKMGDLGPNEFSVKRAQLAALRALQKLTFEMFQEVQARAEGVSSSKLYTTKEVEMLMREDREHLIRQVKDDIDDLRNQVRSWKTWDTVRSEPEPEPGIVPESKQERE